MPQAKVINLNSSNGTIFIRSQNLLNYKGRNLKSDVALPGVQRMGVIPEDGEGGQQWAYRHF